MIRFKIFGIPVTVQPMFWAVMGIIGYLSNDRRADQLLMLIAVFMLAGFVSILIHELGHALTGRKFGSNPEIILHAFGGVAIFPGGRFNRVESFYVTLAGPFIQFTIGLAAYVAYERFGTHPNAMVHALIRSFYIVSMFWAVLNLIPVIPLDGGQLMAAVLGPQRMRLTLMISIGVAIVAAVLLYLRLGSPFMPIYLASFAWQNYEMLKQHRF